MTGNSGATVSRSSAALTVEAANGEVGGVQAKLVDFLLADVTVPGVSCEVTTQQPACPRFANTLAWVGVYDLGDDVGAHSCSMQPIGVVASLPPVLRHYYWAVLIDAHTDRKGTWVEDESGLIERQCGARLK